MATARPTIKELVAVLAGKVDWHNLGTSLEIPIGTLNEIKEEEGANVRRRLTTMLGKWQDRFPQKGWEDIVDALRELEVEGLADEVAKKYCSAATIASTSAKSSAAAMPSCSVEDIKAFGRTIKSELGKKWSTLSDCLEAEMDDFATRLYGKQVISKGARKSKDYNTIMDAFVGAMNVFETVQDYKTHCSILLDILTDIGGPAGRIGTALKSSWNTAVEDEYGIANFF